MEGVVAQSICDQILFVSTSSGLGTTERKLPAKKRWTAREHRNWKKRLYVKIGTK